jgi:hypothetical protein
MTGLQIALLFLMAIAAAALFFMLAMDEMAWRRRHRDLARQLGHQFAVPWIHAGYGLDMLRYNNPPHRIAWLMFWPRRGASHGEAGWHVSFWMTWGLAHDFIFGWHKVPPNAMLVDSASWTGRKSSPIASVYPIVNCKPVIRLHIGLCP